MIPKDFGSSMFSLKNITEYTKQNQNQNSINGGQFMLGNHSLKGMNMFGPPNLNK
jgi:hypothetical protein